MRPDFFFKKVFFVLILYIPAQLILLYTTGCVKEYSQENVFTEPPPDSSSNAPAVHELPSCTACVLFTDPVGLNQWSLQAQQSQACGIVDTAIIDLQRSYFTFFGPSACSPDTGMVITVYLENEKLDRDRTNLRVDKVAFYYYDRVTPSYIYMTSSASAFFVQIDNYNHQTRIASGRFGGSAFRSNSTSAVISSGKFKVKLL